MTVTYHDEIDQGESVEINVPQVHHAHHVDQDHNNGDHNHRSSIEIQTKHQE